MTAVNPGTPVNLNYEGQIVPGVSLGSGDLGDTVDVVQTADRGPIRTGILLTATAANPGEASITAATAAAIATDDALLATAVQSETPLSFRLWDTLFWNWSPTPDLMTITTTQVRDTFVHQAVQRPLQDFRMRVTDDVALSISWLIYTRALGDNTFPALPDITLASDGSGTEQTLIAPGSALVFPAGQGLLLRHVLRTKGGALGTYTLHDWYQRA